MHRTQACVENIRRMTEEKRANSVRSKHLQTDTGETSKHLQKLHSQQGTRNSGLSKTNDVQDLEKDK